MARAFWQGNTQSPEPTPCQLVCSLHRENVPPSPRTDSLPRFEPNKESVRGHVAGRVSLLQAAELHRLQGELRLQREQHEAALAEAATQLEARQREVEAATEAAEAAKKLLAERDRELAGSRDASASEVSCSSGQRQPAALCGAGDWQRPSCVIAALHGCFPSASDIKRHFAVLSPRCCRLPRRQQSWTPAARRWRPSGSSRRRSVRG